MKKSGLPLLGIVCFLVACNQAPKTNNPSTTEKIKTKEDTLYQAVMDLHNETMAKYGKLLGYEKKVQQKTDSLILAGKKCYCEGIHLEAKQFSNLLDTLKAAEKNMNDWMGQFNPDPKMQTTGERAAYFLDQKQKATAMKNNFFEALGRAEHVLGKSSK